MEVKIKRIKPGHEDVKLPKYQTEGSAGMDVCAAIDTPITIAPGQMKNIPTNTKYGRLRFDRIINNESNLK